MAKDPAKVEQGRKNKRRGADRERLAKHILEHLGYGVIKGGGSLGPFDLHAENDGSLLAVQVRSSRWPSPEELQAMLDHQPLYKDRKRIIWRMDSTTKGLQHLVVDVEYFEPARPGKGCPYPGELVELEGRIAEAHAELRRARRERRRDRRET